MPATENKTNFTPYCGEDPALYRIDATTIGDLLLKAYDRFPEHPALVFPETAWTYSELVQRAMRTAQALQAAGVKPRDKVGILLPTSPELVEVFFAVAFCGGVSVLMNARYRANELAYVVENADLVTVITTDTIADQVDFVARLNIAFPDLPQATDAMSLQLDTAPSLRNIVLLGTSSPAGFVDEAAFYKLANQIDPISVHRARVATYVRDTGMMLYTSGTTANPKGCEISHEAMTRESIVLGRHRFQLSQQDKIWSPLPLFHIAAMLPMLSIFDVGGTYMGMGFFEPGQALSMLDEHKATVIFSPFVTHLQAMLYHPNFAKTSLSQVRLMNSCFAAMPESVGKAYRQAMPNTLQLGTFGMTEAAGIVSTGHHGMDPELGFTRLGLPLIGQEVRIIDPEYGDDLPTGERGEVLIRGFNLFSGYYRDEVKTAEALDSEGWFHSGDIGSLDENGHIMFHGRFKDMLKVGGENVAAVEIESLLTRFPGVKLAQVVGIPDEKYLEVPAAFVELESGTAVNEQALIAFCKQEISGFKVPRTIRFVSEWPMSASKIQKFQLRKQLMHELGLKELT
jgi:fatty-acyl-CoA synthase/long-chain acyl-CoA synthetase